MLFLMHFQRFQQSRDSNVSGISLENILPDILRNIKDNFEERVLALEVSLGFYRSQ